MPVPDHSAWWTYKAALLRLADASRSVAECTLASELLALENEFRAAMKAFNAARLRLAEMLGPDAEAAKPEAGASTFVTTPTHPSGRTVHLPDR